MITVLDSTMREGEQTPGVAFDLHIKLAIAGLLDEIGVDVIEAGHPVVSDEIRAAVEALAGRGLRATVAAHARSLDRDVRLALECGVGFLGIFYCVSDDRMGDRGTTLRSSVDQIAGVIARARESQPGLVIRYTPEDAVRSPFENVVAAASAAVEAGADIISVADTTGTTIPGTPRSLYDFVSRLIERLAQRGLSPRFAVHCHNDRGLALANALDGIRAGATIVDASVLGLGERAGIVDLAALMAVLAIDMGEERFNLAKLPELYALVSRYAGVPVPANWPVCGANAFTHCAGVHTEAAIRNPLHYQSLPPEPFGRRSQIALDHMSGMATLRFCLDRIGEHDIDPDLARLVLAKVKEVGARGRSIDDAELTYIVRFLRFRRDQDAPRIPALDRPHRREAATR